MTSALALASKAALARLVPPHLHVTDIVADAHGPVYSSAMAALGAHEARPVPGLEHLRNAPSRNEEPAG